MKRTTTIALFAFSASLFGQTWTTYDVSNSNLATNNTNRIEVDATNGDILVSTMVGFNIKSGSSWSLYTMATGSLGNNVAIEPLREGSNIWVGTDGGGVSRFNGTAWTIFNTSNSGLSDNRVYDQVKAPNGLIWFATRDGGLSVYNGTVFTGISIASNISVTYDRGHSLDIDANGVVWIGTAGGGLAKYNPANSTWAQYTTSNSTIPHNDVYSVKIDVNGKIWAGTSGGLAIFDPLTSQFTNVLTSSNSMLPNNYIRDICFDWSGRAFVATGYGGVARVESNYTINTVWNSSNSALPTDTCWDIAYGGGRVWVATLNEGIASLDVDVSIQEPNASSMSVNVFPSISNGDITVSIGVENNTEATLELYSENGQLVWSKSSLVLIANSENKETVPLGTFARGTYFIVVTGNNMEKYSTQVISE